MPFRKLARRIALTILVCAFALPHLQAAAEPVPSKKIGIIGAGKIGSTFGALWAKAGYEVLLSSRHPEELKPLAESLGPKVRVGTPAEAFAFSKAVLIAIPYKAYPDFGQEHRAALTGKIVLDPGNATKARDGALFDEVQANGVGVTSAKYLPGARIVRAFNAANFELFVANSNRSGARMAVPIAGDDAAAIEVAKTLVNDAGFDPVLVGTLADATKFAMWTRGFGHNMTAPELKAKLGVSP